MSDQVTRSGGIGFFGLLTIVFITLKLIGVIEWSWVWVFSPIWVPFILVFIIGIPIVLIILWNDRR